MLRLISQKLTQFFTSSLTPICKSTGIISTLNTRGVTSLSSLASLKPNWSPRSTWQSQPAASFHLSSSLTGNSLNRMHRTGPLYKKRSKRQPLDGCPQKKGVVLKTLIKKPKKPNSANRKCVLVRLSNGKEAVAYVPGVGHNLQEHNVVLVRCGRLQDVPGVKLKVIRGKYDCAHVKKPTA